MEVPHTLCVEDRITLGSWFSSSTIGPEMAYLIDLPHNELEPWLPCPVLLTQVYVTGMEATVTVLSPWRGRQGVCVPEA